GASGGVTWFLNENDFFLTYAHSEFVTECARRGDTIGVHDHIDFLNGRWEYEAIREFCARSHARVADALSRIAYARPLTAHRFGCFFQHATAYRVVAELGYTICSELVPGVYHTNHTDLTSFDNREIPVGIRPFRHDASNFTEYSSRHGVFFHAPMVHSHLLADYWPQFSFSILDDWIEQAQKTSEHPIVVTLCFHPYEILDIGSLSVDPKRLDHLGEICSRLSSEYSVEYVNIDDCQDRYEHFFEGGAT
ncbi:MAG: hypothetical protein EA426_00950, partial [Spirochaetaceae bacterium]